MVHVTHDEIIHLLLIGPPINITVPVRAVRAPVPPHLSQSRDKLPLDIVTLPSARPESSSSVVILAHLCVDSLASQQCYQCIFR